MLLKNKTILLGVTGGIAAYKSAALASLLVKAGASVHVIMTKNATNFIAPLTFETLTGHKCITDTFDRHVDYQVEHVSLAQQADAMVIAPATANVIAKLAHGIADDMLTTTALACRAPKLIAPAMNTAMYENPITQENLDVLQKYGVLLLSPAHGRLACGEIGIGKMMEPENIMEHILYHCAYPKDMRGLHVLVTAGPTQEAIDPVRFISNHSSGKMGYAIARAFMIRGASVTLVSGRTSLSVPAGVHMVQVVSAREMYDVVCSLAPDMDIIVKAAAVADYRPSQVADEKIKKSADQLSLSLERTDDIIRTLGQRKKPHQFLCGFSMETENMIENSRKKMIEKNLDMIVANNLKEAGAGFACDTNIVTIITEKETRSLEKMTKDQVAMCLAEYIIAQRNQ